MNRRTFLKSGGALLTTASLTTLTGCSDSGYAEADWLSVERVIVPMPNLSTAAEGVRIVLMSDFHLYPYTELRLIRRAVQIANELNPDLVVLAGDFVLESAEAIFDLAPVLARLDATHGVFAALGNHDYWTDAAVIEEGLTAAGIPLLKNRGTAIGGGRDRLYLAGLDDGWSGVPDLTAALDGHTDALPTVLLMHEPDFADDIARSQRVDLMLSGHSHGGQVRLPGIGAPVLPPYGEKYDMGLYQVEAMQLYTTRGIGVIGPPVRINCRPEITEITLVPATRTV